MESGEQAAAATTTRSGRELPQFVVGFAVGAAAAALGFVTWYTIHEEARAQAPRPTATKSLPAPTSTRATPDTQTPTATVALERKASPLRVEALSGEWMETPSTKRLSMTARIRNIDPRETYKFQLNGKLTVDIVGHGAKTTEFSASFAAPDLAPGVAYDQPYIHASVEHAWINYGIEHIRLALQFEGQTPFDSPFTAEVLEVDVPPPDTHGRFWLVGAPPVAKVTAKPRRTKENAEVDYDGVAEPD